MLGLFFNIEHLNLYSLISILTLKHEISFSLIKHGSDDLIAFTLPNILKNILLWGAGELALWLRAFVALSKEQALNTTIYKIDENCL